MMKKIKQIMLLFIVFAAGVVVGNFIEIGIPLDTLGNLYNVTDYADTILDYFK